MRIAVLALQGAFIEHEQMLERLGAECFEVRQLADWEQEKDGLVIPGGESTTQLRLLKDLGLLEPVRDYINGGGAVFGTCAGLILMSKKTGDPRCTGLGLIDCTAKRNAYGRQIGSFDTVEEFGDLGKIPMVFIRAPYISRAGDGVDVLAMVNKKIVAARQGNFLVTAFHPELTDDLSVHKYFIDMIKA